MYSFVGKLLGLSLRFLLHPRPLLPNKRNPFRILKLM
jgi:hypothetical protein